MDVKYLIRLDDACPYMNRQKWLQMENLLDNYSIKPLVGIIPANLDKGTMKDPEDPLFWEKAHKWEDKGWSIALHGYTHVCDYYGGLKGLNPMWIKSEFAGVPLEIQREKIRSGYNVLKEHDFNPRFFFAPRHTFDANTIKALEEETDIRIISDTIGRYPYRSGNFIFIPQISGHCVRVLISGFYTFCFHPNTMNNDSFIALERFIKRYRKQFVSFDEIDLTQLQQKKLFDKLLTKIFFLKRRIQGRK